MFHNRVERIPIDDHNVPRLRLESDSSQVVSLSISLYWRVTCDGKEESKGERVFLSSPFSSPLLLSCMLREKTTGEKSGLE